MWICVGPRDPSTKPSRGWLRVVVRKPRLGLSEYRATRNKVTATPRHQGPTAGGVGRFGLTLGQLQAAVKRGRHGSRRQKKPSRLNKFRREKSTTRRPLDHLPNAAQPAKWRGMRGGHTECLFTFHDDLFKRDAFFKRRHPATAAFSWPSTKPKLLYTSLRLEHWRWLTSLAIRRAALLVLVLHRHHDADDALAAARQPPPPSGAPPRGAARSRRQLPPQRPRPR